jgi:hypothetical protein
MILVQRAEQHNREEKSKNRSNVKSITDLICGLVVRVPGYRSRDPRVRFLALPDFLKYSGSGIGFTQPREGN